MIDANVFPNTIHHGNFAEYNNPHGMGVTKTVLSFDILSVTKHVKRNPFYTGELFDFRKKYFSEKSSGEKITIWK